MKRSRFLLTVAGLVLIVFGLVLFNSVVSAFEKPLSTISGSAFTADFTPDAPVINQGDSVTFSISNIVPFNSVDAPSQLGQCNWLVDGTLAYSGSTDFTYYGASPGTHTIEVDLTFAYDEWQHTESMTGYNSVTVLSNSPTASPNPTYQPTPSPTWTPNPTPIGQTPYPTAIPTSTPIVIIPVPKNNTELILLVTLGSLLEGAGVFSLWLSRRL